ncbi:MAG: calcium-binding protein, partial [Pseudomonadota bacterium]
DAVEVMAASVGSRDYVLMSDSSSQGIITYQREDDGSLTHVNVTYDNDDIYLDGVAAMATASLGGSTYVVAAGAADSGITVYKLNFSGRLTETAALGFNEFLPVTTPQAMEIVTVADTAFVVMASSGTSSLTVLELSPEGTLTAVDQVNDDLFTRFNGAQVMETVNVDGQVFVLVSGSDDGISLFTLMPDGRLVLLDTIVDDTEMGLSNVAAIQAVAHDGTIDVFVTSTNAAGVTQLSLDLGQIGAVGGAVGTDGRDQLLLDDGGATVDAGAGQDIIVDGDGFDVMTGGAGADIFILSADGVQDQILDFELGTDTLDLSEWGFLRDLRQVTVQSTSNGAILTFGSESLRLFSANGASISVEDLTTQDILNGTHVDLSFVGGVTFEVPAIEGTEADDTLTGTEASETLLGLAGDDILTGGAGEDIIDGGEGTDLADYSTSGIGLIVNLTDTSANTGHAEGDSFVSIEGIMGTQFDDTLTGTSRANTIYGQDGLDIIYALGGSDTIYGGSGDDFLDGASGDDIIWGEGGNDSLLGRKGDDTLYGGAGNDNIAAHEGDDIVYGGQGDDQLGGSDGNDQMFGGAGNDTIGSGADDDFIDAGDGDDVASGGWGTDEVRGGAGNDTLAGSYGHDIVMGEDGNDSLGGGTGNDYLYGGAGDDLLGAGDDDDFLFGEAGDDFLGGGSGDDQMDGGTGNDTLNGGEGRDRMTGGDGSDVFVFNTFQSGELDWITDFEIGVDQMRMKFVEDRFEGLEIRNVTVEGQSYAQITYDNHRIRLEDVDADDLSESDFIFLG